jgi:hypothetical protein
MTRIDKVFADGLRVDLFAGFPVREYATSAAWYERLLGCPPAFLPNEVEAVWELAEHRYIFIKFQPEHAGHAFNLFFLSDFDGFIAGQAGGLLAQPDQGCPSKNPGDARASVYLPWPSDQPQQ